MALLSLPNVTAGPTMIFSNQSDVSLRVTSEPTSLLTSYRYTAREYIILTSPVILILGTVFNGLSVIVLRRPRFAKMSTSVYLIALAAVDTIYLYSNSMTKNFIKIVWAFNYSTQFPMGCSLYVYFLLVSRCIGAWLIVSVTLERLIVICIPIKAKIIATRKRAMIITLAIATTIVTIYLYVLVVFEVSVDEKGKKGCDMQVYYIEKGVDFALKMMDMAIFSVLPTIILFASNAVIIYKVAESSKFRGAVTAPVAVDNTGKDDTARRLTVMLLSVSSAFLVLTLPLAAFLTHATLYFVKNFEIIYRSLYMLQISNSAINFLLYCASGPAFRKELLLMFLCGRLVTDTSVGSSEQTQSKQISTIESNKY